MSNTKLVICASDHEESPFSHTKSALVFASHYAENSTLYIKGKILATTATGNMF
jgi:hypothetical protein